MTHNLYRVEINATTDSKQFARKYFNLIVPFQSSITPSFLVFVLVRAVLFVFNYTFSW